MMGDTGAGHGSLMQSSKGHCLFVRSLSCLGECWYNECHFAKCRTIIYCVRRKPLWRRQCARSPSLSLSRKSGFTQDIDVKSIWRAHMQPALSFLILFFFCGRFFPHFLVSCSNKRGCLAGLEKLVFPFEDTDSRLDCLLLSRMQ